jgi:hypothetical protein
MSHIDAVLDRLISQAIDHIAADEPTEAIEDLIEIRLRAESWGRTMTARTKATTL